MKSRFLWFAGFSFSAILVLHLANYVALGSAALHPSLNNEAEKPDIHFENANLYFQDHDNARSARHIRKAIASMQKIKGDIDEDSGGLLAKAIQRLENVCTKAEMDSMEVREMMHAFEYALNALAISELRLSGTCAETNQRKKAFIALKHAYVHLKHVNEYTDLNQKSFAEREKTLLEVDSLLQNNSLSTVSIVIKVDKIITTVEKWIEND